MGLERIFLPLFKVTAPDLIDYRMPENGVFHNLILAKLNAWYPAHAKQMMHAFLGSRADELCKACYLWR